MLNSIKLRFLQNIFWVYLLGSIALSFVLYGNTVFKPSEFVYDDTLFSLRPELRDIHHLKNIWLEAYSSNDPNSGAYRPLSVFTFALNYIVFGESTRSFHVVNVILNGIFVFLVFVLVNKIFNNKRLAVFSALFFAFLPIHTEAVAFIKARDDLLSSIFAILAWLLFINATTARHRINYKKVFLSSLLFFLAVLAKDTVIIFPALFLAAYFLKRGDWAKTIKLGLVFVPITVVYFIMRFLALGEYFLGKENVFFVFNPLIKADFWTRIWTAFELLTLYIGKTLIPVNLTATYHYNHVPLVSNPFDSLYSLAGIILMASVLYLIFSKKYQSTPIGIGALVFLVPYLIISKFLFKYGGELMGERWMYFPSVGISIIAGYFLEIIYIKHKRLALLILIAVLSIYAYITIPRNEIWLTNEALYKSMRERSPNSAMGYGGLANFYASKDDFDRAKKEAAEAYKIYPDHPPLINLIGLMALKEGNNRVAEGAFLKAIELRPDYIVSYLRLGNLYYSEGKYEKALEYLAYVTEYRGDIYKTDLTLLLALTFIKLERYEESIYTIQNFIPNYEKDLRARFTLTLSFYKLNDQYNLEKYIDSVPKDNRNEKLQFIRDVLGGKINNSLEIK